MALAAGGLFEGDTHFRALASTPEETRQIGHMLGALLKPGDCVFLYGDVGAGKTVFTAGMASALGIGGNITSPTFTIANTYDGSIALYHFDAYRIESPDELVETGFFDYIGGDCVVAIEWAERLGGYVPDGCALVWIGRAGGCDTQREIKIEFAGKRNHDNG